MLREWSTAPVLDIPAFVNGLIFNVLIGNADAHGKNHSMLYSGGERRLSPFYDLVSTLAWPELTTNLAMKIGSCDSINAFMIGDWKKMAHHSGLGWPIIRERMAELSRAILNQCKAVSNQTEKDNEEITGRLHDMIGDRAARLIEELSKQGC
jgi:serine/threonine-protein kinase HipA